MFSRPTGEPVDPDTLSKSFGRLITAAKVTRITFHGLRHTHISHLLMDGVHVKVVSERAGHANVNITLNTYAAYIPNMQADAALRVDAWLRQGVKEGTPGLPGGNSVGNQPIRERLVQQAIEENTDGPVAQPDRAAVS